MENTLWNWTHVPWSQGRIAFKPTTESQFRKWKTIRTISVVFCSYFALSLCVPILFANQVCFSVYMTKYSYSTDWFDSSRHTLKLSLNSKRKSDWLNLRQMPSFSYFIGCAKWKINFWGVILKYQMTTLEYDHPKWSIRMQFWDTDTKTVFLF